MAFEQVQAKCPAAGDLLNLCAFLAPEAICVEELAGAREHLPDRPAKALADEMGLDEIEAALYPAKNDCVPALSPLYRPSADLPGQNARTRIRYGVMVANARTLILGSTGVSKRDVAEKIKRAARERLGQDLRVLDFEKEFLMPQLVRQSLSWEGYLLDPRWQKTCWPAAWKCLVSSLDSTPTVLTLHSTVVQCQLGVLPAVDVESVAGEFRPTLIINLIDDVYNMWWRTEAHADGLRFRGQPTLEQLLMARRVESFMGDLLARKAETGTSRVRHVMCSVHHPLDVVLNLIFFDAKVAYLSFPIAEPRKVMRENRNCPRRTPSARWWSYVLLDRS